MAVYHRTYRNSAILLGGQRFEVDGDGRLCPDPSPKQAAIVAPMSGFLITEEAEAPPAEKPKAKAKPKAKKAKPKKA